MYYVGLGVYDVGQESALCGIFPDRITDQTMASKFKMVLAAGAIAVASLGVGQVLISHDSKKIKGSFLKSAIALMREEPEVKKLLGEKFTIGSRSLKNDFTRLEPKRLQLMLPIAGEKDNGYLFAYARRKSENEKFKLYKIEMKFDKVNGQKLVLLDLGEDTDATYSHETENEDYDKKKAREELFARMDAEFGPVSPAKEWRKRLEK